MMHNLFIVWRQKLWGIFVARTTREVRQPMIYTWGQGSEPIDFQALGLEFSGFSAPAWSPDGQLVAFHAGGGAIEEGTGGMESTTVIYDPRDNSVDVLHRYFGNGQRGGPENA